MKRKELEKMAKAQLIEEVLEYQASVKHYEARIAELKRRLTIAEDYQINA